jgi:hypothetical protein
MTVQQSIADLAKAGYTAFPSTAPDTIVVQDPVFVERGAAAGRFLEFKAVTIKVDQVFKFISDRS